MIDAEKLRDAVNSLLECAKQSDAINFGAVNWGDLKVVDVVKETSLLSDYSEVFVVVDEAAPDGPLASWLTEQLNEPGVTVRTEW